MKFVNTSNDIDAIATFAINTGAYWRPAKTQGGRWSGSGLTLFGPFWVEEGAVRAFREDVIPADGDKLLELVYGMPGSLVGELVIFSDHGTEPVNIRTLNVQRLLEALQDWNLWRPYGTSLPPACSTEEDFAAKRATRGVGPNLTAGEALRGLVQRRGAGEARLSIEYDPASPEGYWKESWDWEVLVSGIGRARGSSETEGVEPSYFVFEDIGDRDEWEYEEGGQTWKVVRTFHVFPSEGGLKAEYRWSRAYDLPEEEGAPFGSWHTEYAITDDKDGAEWAMERPW